VEHFCRSYFYQLANDILIVSRYVAMHAMQEDSNHDHSSANGYPESPSAQRKQAKPRMRDTFAAVGGMLIPLITQIGPHA
jgi:solute carrier family 39 (zinc transporter), member 9